MKNGIAWSDEYAVGNIIIDAQHMRLFALVGNLVSYCAEGSDVKRIRETLGFLVTYIDEHFADEEELQIGVKYPGYEAHKRMHDNFRTSVAKFIERYDETGITSSLSGDINKVVVKWLVNHVMKEDKAIGEYIRSKKA